MSSSGTPFKTPVNSKVVSISISTEIQRFESVHPSIYAVYDLLEHVGDQHLANLIKGHIVNIEDSFVNSQEWTLSRSTPTINLGILGSTLSLKSTLVHRYLTNLYVHDTSPEGGRFKKELLLHGRPYLLLIRDEGGAPEIQFSHWADVLILVANDVDSMKTCLAYVSRLASYKSLNELPIVLVSAGGSASAESTYLDQFKQIPHQLFFSVDVVSGKNVETAFTSACKLVLSSSSGENNTTSSSVKISRRKSNIFNKSQNSKDTQKDGNHGGDLNVTIQTREIPLKQGQILKKSSKKTWKKKYLTLTSDKLIYYDNINSYMERNPGKVIDLRHANVVKAGEKRFTVNTVNKVFEFEAGDGTEGRDDWVEGVQKGIMEGLQLNCGGFGGGGSGGFGGGGKEKGVDGRGSGCGGEFFWDYDVCADCGDDLRDNAWVSINLGVVVCIGCSGIHRNLGCHLSRVRSLKLDAIGPLTYKTLNALEGTESTNIRLYEATLKGSVKRDSVVHPKSSTEEKSSFIRRKYVGLDWLSRSSAPTRESLLRATAERDFACFLNVLLRMDKSHVALVGCDLLEHIGKFVEPEYKSVWVQHLLWALEGTQDTRAKEKLRSQINLALPEADVKLLSYCD